MAQSDTAYRELNKALQALVLDYADIASKARAILRTQIKAKGLSEFDAADQLLALLDGAGWRRLDRMRKKVCHGGRKKVAVARRQRGLELRTGDRRSRRAPAQRTAKRVAKAATGSTGSLPEGTF
jgi:hypothetical protein